MEKKINRIFKLGSRTIGSDGKQLLLNSSQFYWTNVTLLGLTSLERRTL